MARVTPERTQRLHVSGMKGPVSAVKIEEALRQLAGVEDVQYEPNEGIATIAGEIEPQDLIEALSANNYQVKPLGDSH